MSETTDILREAKRLRLLTAALKLQHYTSTEANVVPIPGTDGIIAIKTSAQVAQLLEPPTAAASRNASELIDLLKAIRPNYGDVGTGDVDVGAQQKRIDRAVDLLQVGAARDRRHSRVEIERPWP